MLLCPVRGCGQALTREERRAHCSQGHSFDVARSGFAHIHPQPSDLNRRPDPDRPQLTFRVQIPQAGRYVIWSQFKTGGREHFVPFWIEVSP